MRSGGESTLHEVPGDVFRRSGGQLGLRCRLAEDGMELPIEVADDGATTVRVPSSPS
jgi:hypothetical protein